VVGSPFYTVDLCDADLFRKKMSLNDVYSQKYTPNHRTEALAYIDSVLHEAEEKVHNDHQFGQKLRKWKEVHAMLARGQLSENGANQTLSIKRLPLLEDDYEPSEDNLLQWMVQDQPLQLDYNLLSAIRDAIS